MKDKAEDRQDKEEKKGAEKERAAQPLAKRLAFTALFAALCCVATVVIVVPLANGYFNAGDVFVLLAGWCLGPLFGGMAAGVGSALADILSGYVLYAPVTFFVKGLDAAAAYFVWRLFKKLIRGERADVLARLPAAILAEAWMVFGYFAFECCLYGLAGGAASLVGNALQGALCTVSALLLVEAFYNIKPVRRFFPLLVVQRTQKER